MHLDKPLHERESDAQPPMCAVERADGLREQVKNVRRHL
jgi:hypothetical protein